MLSNGQIRKEKLKKKIGIKTTAMSKHLQVLTMFLKLIFKNLVKKTVSATEMSSAEFYSWRYLAVFPRERKQNHTGLLGVTCGV